MDAYTSFARVYDMFMDNVPYEEWCDYITGLLKEYGISNGLVLDLGCGTGSMTELLAARGFDMIGVDCSEDMLEIALEKRMASGRDILYLQQDMRDLELYGTVRAVVCLCDSINYLLDVQDLETVFRLVNNYLDPGGIFIFDLNTEYKYRELLADRTIAENRDEGSFIWDNYYDEESRINEYDLALFIPAEEADAGKMGEGAGPDCETGAASGSGTSGEGLYRKYQETHFQRAYTLDEIREALERAGMEFLTWYDGDGDGRQAPREDSERIYVIAREKGKEV
ncbi:MAG TPA: class I SAM-dependent methyltransferase [Candidatus Caccovicinus merdipullorum]|uniref:Class I SAM-dependent methyltransferase n=1 Tax=Candidatus Caccovicinus merdipullorum TaxID=2840724 RepID=A0A9D1GJ55_9FIRM|nr:class I SAM-dependent methyltransferase [Candidatus Caccovicinus merdipullorum]